jgi:hypothetical protein
MRLAVWILSIGLVLAALVQPAAAFCGFYVARADGSLYNRASKVVYTRANQRSVITMSSDYRGPAAEFAMIVPTPSVLERNAVRVVKTKTVDQLDAYTAPRLVEYFDGDPCELLPTAEPEVAMEAAGAAPTTRERRDGAKALGVTILREYAVGIYDIQMLSAKQSDGLAAFLISEGYKLPPGAEEALQGYIQMGMKFFVARVNLGRHAADSAQELEPLQISFRSMDFMLPIQLGKVNGDGPQDLLVMTLTRGGAVTLANHPIKRIPSDETLPVFVKDLFPDFYRAMFDRIAPRSGAFVEYAWDMSWCDPCAADPLSHDQLKELGVNWVRRADAATPDVFVTRLHIRYDKGSFREDLMFRETADRENFQGRYILNHPFEGEITCDAGKTYVAETRRRVKDEAARLQTLTGWSAGKIAQRIAATVPPRYR